jgi:hypothetical protein
LQRTRRQSLRSFLLAAELDIVRLPLEDALAQRWSEVVARAWASGFGALTEPERVWVSVRALIDSVENGGAISYFYNSYADQLPYCLSALSQLELHGIAGALNRLCSMFPGGVPDTLEGRNAVIESWPHGEAGNDIDARLSAIDHEIEALIPEAEARLKAFLAGQGVAT